MKCTIGPKTSRLIIIYDKGPTVKLYGIKLKLYFINLYFNALHI